MVFVKKKEKKKKKDPILDGNLKALSSDCEVEKE